MVAPSYWELPRSGQPRIRCGGVRCALLSGGALGAEAPGEALATLGDAWREEKAS